MPRKGRHSSEPTPREQQILELICEGHSTKQIAGLLGISFKTAACHRMRLMDKAGVHDPISLFRWALLEGHIVLNLPTNAGKRRSDDPPFVKVRSNAG